MLFAKLCLHPAGTNHVTAVKEKRFCSLSEIHSEFQLSEKTPSVDGLVSSSQLGINDSNFTP